MGGSRKPLPLQLWALERLGHFWIETLRRLGLRLTSLHVLGFQTVMLQAYFCYTHQKKIRRHVRAPRQFRAKPRPEGSEKEAGFGIKTINLMGIMGRSS